MTVFDLLVRIGVDLSSLRSGMSQAAGEVQAGGSSMSSALGLIGSSAESASVSMGKFYDLQSKASALTSVGEGIAATFAIPAAGLAASVVAFADFDAALTKSLAIQEGVTTSMRDKLAAAAIDLSKTISVSAKDSASSYYFLASAGFTVDQQIAALPVVANFAKAGLVGMNDAASILTRSQFALGLASKDAGENLKNLTMISDLLVKADTLALGKTQEFAAALTNKGATTAKTFGIELKDLVAILASFSQAGIRGAQAGTYLEMAMRQLTQAPIGKYAGEWKRLGVEVYDSSGKFRSIVTILSDLQKAMAGMTDQQRKTELGLLGIQSRAQFAMLPLLGLTATTADLRQKLEDFGGTSQRVAANQMQTFNEQMKLMWNRVTALGIVVGAALVPALEGLARVMEPLFGFIEHLATQFQTLPKGMQITIVSAAALVTGLGLLGGVILIAAGQIISLLANLSLLGVALPNVTAAAAAFGTSLVFLRGAALLAAGAFAGWELGTWLRQNIPLMQTFGDGVADLILKIPGMSKALNYMTGATQANVVAQQTQATAVMKLKQALIEHGIVVEQGSLSQKDYGQKLMDTAKASGLLKTSHQAAGGAIKETTVNMFGAGVSAKELAKHERDSSKAATELAAAYDHLGLTSKKLNDDQKASKLVWADLTGQTKTTASTFATLALAMEKGIISLPKFLTEWAKISAEMKIAESALHGTFQAANAGPKSLDQLSASTVQLITQWLKVPPTATKITEVYLETSHGARALAASQQNLSLAFSSSFFPTEKVTDYSDRLKIARLNLIALQTADPGSVATVWIMKEISALETLQGALSNTTAKAMTLASAIVAQGDAGITAASAFEFLGTKSQAELDSMADAAQVAYRSIADSSESNTRAASDSFIRMVDMQRAAGRTLSPEMEAQYARMKNSTEGVTRSIGESWIGAARRIKESLVNDLSRAMSDIIFQTGKISDAFKRMGQQVVDIILETIIKKGVAKLLDSLSNVGGLVGKIAGWFGGGSSGGASGAVIPGISGQMPPGLGGAAGSSSSSAGGALGSASSSGLSGIVGMITGGISAVSNIVSNFQQAHMSSDLQKIEQNTRFTMLATTGNGNSLVNMALANWPRINDTVFRIENTNDILQLIIGETLLGIKEYSGKAANYLSQIATGGLKTSTSSSGTASATSLSFGGGTNSVTFSPGSIVINTQAADGAEIADALFRELTLRGIKV